VLPVEGGTPLSEPLFSMTDAEIRDAATRTAIHVQFAYGDYLAELDRRSNRRLTLTIAVSTTVYAVLTALLIAVTALKP
jgi:hypothetical protein